MLLPGKYLLESCVGNKVPNYKHQITNKSQITIFNDQIIPPGFIASLLKPESVSIDAGWHNRSRAICLVF
jgi:hypothetical protein